MRRRLFSSLLTGVLMMSSVHADVLVGFKACNNLWKNHWLITPAMEITFGGKWFMVEGDGTYGIHEISRLNRGYAYQLSFSLTPMLRVPFFGPLYGALGYGVNYTYRREELLADDGKYLLASEELIRGQAQVLLGAALPLSRNMKLYAHGGASYIDSENLRIFGTVGLNLRWPLPYPSEPDDSQRPRSSDRTLPTPAEEEIVPFPAPDYRSSRREGIRLAIIGSDDPVVSEFISGLQVSLLEEGIHIYNWDKINISVDSYYRQVTRDTIPPDSLSAFPGRKRPVSIALEGAKLFDLDGVIDLQLRYQGNTDQTIQITSAFIRLINPQTGEIIWATEYRGGGQPYDHGRKTLSQALIKAIEKWYQ